MTYQWTDWITHIPGQELLAGTYGLFEFIGRRPPSVRNAKPFEPYQVEGVINRTMKNNPCWYMTDPNGDYVQLIRYKLRSIVDDKEIVETSELELV